MSLNMQKLETQSRRLFWFSLFSLSMNLLYGIIINYRNPLEFNFTVMEFMVDIITVTSLSFFLYKRNPLASVLFFSNYTLSAFFTFSNLVNLIVAWKNFLSLVYIFLVLIFQFIIISGLIANFKIYYQETKFIQIFPRLEKSFYIRLIFFISLWVAMVYGIKFIKPYIYNSIQIGKNIPEVYKEYAISEKIIDPDEQIQYWYSDDYMDFKKHYVFLTDKKLVVKNQNKEQEEDYKIPIDRIYLVRMTPLDNFKDYSLIRFVYYDQKGVMELSFYTTNYFGIDNLLFTTLNGLAKK